MILGMACQCFDELSGAEGAGVYLCDAVGEMECLESRLCFDRWAVRALYMPFCGDCCLVATNQGKGS